MRRGNPRGCLGGRRRRGERESSTVAMYNHVDTSIIAALYLKAWLALDRDSPLDLYHVLLCHFHYAEVQPRVNYWSLSRLFGMVRETWNVDRSLY